PDEVEVVTGAPASRLVNDFILGLAKSDAAKAISVLQEILSGSTNAKVFIKLTIQKLRSILILRLSPALKAMVEKAHTEEDFSFIEDVAKNIAEYSITSKTLSRMLQAYD